MTISKQWKLLESLDKGVSRYNHFLPIKKNRRVRKNDSFGYCDHSGANIAFRQFFNKISPQLVKISIKKILF
jgi:hypothetical protein